MKPRTRTLWTFVVTSIALFMVVLDNLVVSTAIPVIRVDLGASLEQLEWTVNAYTLTFAVFLLTGAALGDRFGRKRMFMLGVGIFTAASAAAALAPVRRLADRGAGGPGHRRGDRDAANAHAPQRGRPARAAGSRTRRLVRYRRPGRRDGAAGRRRGRRRHRVAVDLLAQRARRAHPAPARHALAGVEGPDSALDLVGLGLAGVGMLGLVWGLIHGNGDGWTSPLIVASLVSRRGRPDRLRPLGAPDAAADAADPVLPQPGVRRGERGIARSCTSGCSARSSC